MALPVFRAASAKAAGTGAVTPALPAGMSANDIVILVASTIAGGSISITANGSIGTWTAITGSPIDVTGGEKLYVWWGRWASGTTGPTVTPGSDHCCAGTAAWSGCITDSSVINNQNTGSETTSDTSFSFATAISTTVKDAMCLCVCSSGVDSNTAQVGVMANTSLAALASRLNFETASGLGGGFGLSEGTKAVAGSMGTWTATLTSATPKSYITFALRPPNDTITKTQTGKARIRATTTQTTTGKARVQKTVAQTTTGVASIVAGNVTTAQTTTGKARVQVTASAAQTGNARLQKTASQTQAGKARLQKSAAVPTTGTARIKTTALQTTTGKSRVQATTQRAQTGVASIASANVTTSQTTPGKARVQVTTSQATTGKARLQKSSAPTQSGQARIQLTVPVAITGKSRVQATTQRAQTGVANIAAGNLTTAQTITGTARITAAPATGGGGGGIYYSPRPLPPRRPNITTAVTITGAARIQRPVLDDALALLLLDEDE